MNPLIVVIVLAAPPRLEVSVGAGGSSNPFELPNDQAATNADAPQPGVFLPVEAELDLRSSRERQLQLRFDAWLDGDFYAVVMQDPNSTRSTSPSDANNWSAGVSVPMIAEPEKLPVNFTLEPFVALHRETFTSHRSGRPFVAVGGTSLADRYNTNRFGAEAELDVSVARRIDLIGGVRVARVDYVEDYDGTAYDSYDHDEYKTEVDLLGTPGDWVYGAGYSLVVRDYDERFPRDSATGAKVLPGTPGYEPQIFTSHAVTLRGGWSSREYRAVGRYELTRRIDEFAGYLDYTEHAVSADFRIAIGDASELRIEPDFSIRTYDAAKVNFDPLETDSERMRISLDASYEWPLAKWTAMFVSAGVVNQESTNALYSYRAFRAATGVRVTWR